MIKIITITGRSSFNFLPTLSFGLISQWSLSLSSLNPASVRTFRHSFTTETKWHNLNSFNDPTKIYMALPITFNENVKYYTLGIYHDGNSLHFLAISDIH